MIIIPIEVKIRELSSRLYLAYKLLTKTNIQKIILGGQREILSNINFYNSIYLDKGTHSFVLDKLSQIKRGNNKIFQLDEEGPLSLFSSKDIKIRYPQNLNPIVDRFFLWGPKDKKKINTTVDLKKTFVSGHPKYDLLKKPFINIFEKDKNNLKAKYGKYILYASNFSCDHILDKKILNKYINDLDNSKEKIIFKKFIRDTKEELNNYEYVVNFLKKFSSKIGDFKIIFRPHPQQDILKVKKRFKGVRNIRVIYNNSITPWIIGSSVYMHSGCTTSLEASMLKKKIYFINKFKKQNNILHNIGIDLKSADFENILHKIKKRSKTKKISSQLIFNSNKDLMSKNFLKEFEIINKKSVNRAYFEKRKNLKVSYVKRNILSFLSKIKSSPLFKDFLYIFFKGNMLLNKNYKLKKFDNLGLKELIAMLNQFSIIEKKKKLIKVKQICKSTFLLYK